VACQVLSEAIGHSFGDLVPDYLIEQIENMVSLKLIDGYYPRLSLAPGQRFASEGDTSCACLRGRAHPWLWTATGWCHDAPRTSSK